MALVNNGYKRAESITIIKYVNGVPQPPIKYWITDAFCSFSAISSASYQALSDVDFIIRRDAFILCISNIEIGVVILKEQFEIYDPTTCPLPTTNIVETVFIHIPNL